MHHNLCSIQTRVSGEKKMANIPLWEISRDL
jgi:hypothetical protein